MDDLTSNPAFHFLAFPERGDVVMHKIFPEVVLALCQYLKRKVLRHAVS